MPKITEQRTYDLADVRAWPDEVGLIVPRVEQNLTIGQARALGEALIEAADLAPHLDWEQNAPEDAPRIVDVRTKEPVAL